jgi:hypothetical protein
VEHVIPVARHGVDGSASRMPSPFSVKDKVEQKLDRWDADDAVAVDAELIEQPSGHREPGFGQPNASSPNDRSLGGQCERESRWPRGR